MEAKLAALKRAGISLALDDFGTGYSSLSYMQNLPIDRLKLDRSFIMAIESESGPTPLRSARPIIQTIAELARNLEVELVAEGVETDIQREFLQSIGCDVFQGYLFGRPCSAADFETFTAFNDDSPPDRKIVKGPVERKSK
jgi:EAL domain-containing protein (putative c-di-GMP-specific phosphodiesterase class I)